MGWCWRYEAGPRPAVLGIAVLAVVLAAPAVAAGRAGAKNGASKVYRWVDEQGVVHFGDQVPPEYASADKSVLNRHGVTVGSQDGAPSTPEEIAAAKAEAAAREAREAERRRDQVLISTYMTVDEIRALRDNRMELIDAQIRVTESYLSSLRRRQAELQTEASGFRPYSTDPEAPPIEQVLAEELADTLESISLYERTLIDSRKRQGRLRAQFDADIARFEELASAR
jgi:hypothetical protein